MTSLSSQDLLDAVLQEKKIASDLEDSDILEKNLSLLQETHEKNALLLDRFITLYGWPLPQKFGVETHEAACLIATHASSLSTLQLRFLTCLHSVMKRYNIALLALEKEPYIQEAKRLFSKVHDNYLLGDGSFPHVTLCQFYADDLTLEAVLRDLQEIKRWPFPTFTGISFQKEKDTSRWWAALSVLREEPLLHLRKNMTSLLSSHKIVPLNPSETSYLPHLTLARISSQEIRPFDDTLLTQRPFALALGEADFFGQFVRTRYASSLFFE